MKNVISFLPTSAFADEADSIRAEQLRRERIQSVVVFLTRALYFLAGALATITIQLFYR